MFLKTIKQICHQGLKKIRINDTQNNVIPQLFIKRRVLRSKDDDEGKTELRKLKTI